MESLWVATEFPNLERVAVECPAVTSIAELSTIATLRKLFLGSDLSRKLSYEILLGLAIEALTLTIRNSSDIHFIAQIKKLEWLSVANWPLEDFSSLSRLSCRRFQSRGGKAKSTAGLNVSELIRGQCDLQLSSRLQNLKDLDTMHLSVAECPNVDFASLSSARNLKFLEIQSCRQLGSLSFVDNCPSLVVLEINDTRTTQLDFLPLFPVSYTHLTLPTNREV